MRVLVTAFEPYDVWKMNSSWDALVAYVSHQGANANVLTRRYPVDLTKLQSRLDLDLAQGVDAVLHLGQAPGSSGIQLESIALNIAGVGMNSNNDFGELVHDAPVAYRTRYPVGKWAQELKSTGIPSQVSYHAGTYLCNAAMYLSHHWFARRHEQPLVGFLHLPLTPEQTVGEYAGLPSMSTSVTSHALKWIIDRIFQLNSSNATQFA